MTLVPLLIYGATFAAVTSLMLLLLGYWTRFDQQIGQRIDELSAKKISAISNKSQFVRGVPAKDKRASTSKTNLAVRLMTNDQDERHRLQTRLLNAGIYSPLALPLYLSAKFILMCGPPIAGVLAGTFGWINPNLGMLWGSLLGVAGMMIPSIWLYERKRKWHSIITRSLADFLDLMVACLEVGLSVEAALQRVTEELKLAHPKLWVELSVVQAQIDLGASPDTALKNFADRSDSEAIRAVATVVQQGRRLGGGMAEVFRQQAESLRVRREHLVEEKAQQASVKILIPTLLFIFPVIFVVLAGPAVIKVSNMYGPEANEPKRNQGVARR